MLLELYSPAIVAKPKRLLALLYFRSIFPAVALERQIGKRILHYNAVDIYQGLDPAYRNFCIDPHAILRWLLKDI